MSGATEHEPLAPLPDARQLRIERVQALLREQLGYEPTPEQMLDHMMRRDFVMDEGVRVAISLWMRRWATRLALEERARALFPEAEVKLS